MRYAKLINSSPVYDPNPILVNDFRIGNPLASLLLEQGYKPVTYTEAPQTEPGYRAVETWTETDEAIVQGWTVEEVTELDGEEAMRMLFGEEETNVE